MAGKDGIDGLMNIGGYDQARIARLTQAAEKGKALQSGLSPKREAEIQNAATQFEALLLQQMLKEMWQTVPSNGLLDGGGEQQFYWDMFNEKVAEQLAEKQSLGIKDIISKDLRRLEGK